MSSPPTLLSPSAVDKIYNGRLQVYEEQLLTQITLVMNEGMTKYPCGSWSLPLIVATEDPKDVSILIRSLNQCLGQSKWVFQIKSEANKATVQWHHPSQSQLAPFALDTLHVPGLSPSTSVSGFIETNNPWVVGTWVNAEDHIGKVYGAQVIEVSSSSVRVHFDGWSSNSDEKIPINSLRITPYHTKYHQRCDTRIKPKGPKSGDRVYVK